MPVTLHVWRVPGRLVGAAMFRVAFPGRFQASFAKFLGTSRGFLPSDADLTRYAALTVSDSPVHLPKWDKLAVAAARIDLEPLLSRGAWSGVSPFTVSPQTESPGDGMVLALTRARLRPSKMITFYRAVPAVAREALKAPGLLAHFGVGEAPIGFQGTISVWRNAADLARFAYRQPEHRAVIARTPADRWYAEELFARFAVREISGDRAVLGWAPDDPAPAD
ncbi:monooxygenase [Actinoplanes sp. LDG1-06]|uniref:Monooxygenase n=1 Tax=Paractinoplanes ovalisporus TaxID=2810368 RepID=A0ABS2A5W1_9ACTN|nr:monooxygenase [Actinoplanes ovalisporus]MBM2615237.1 monooxygenase [Actinoplanes ovalisporus]